MVCQAKYQKTCYDICMDKILGENIREIRTINKLLQKEFGEKVGVNQRTVSSWEMGQSEPSVDMIRKICKEFDVTADELLGIDK